MATVEFIDPSGDTIANPSVEYLREIFLNRGAGYWSGESGDAGLFFDDGSSVSQIVIMWAESLGFCLQYNKDGKDLSVLSGEDESGEVVTLFLGGDELTVPKLYFVTPEAAWLAIQEFRQTGERAANVSWVEWRPL